MYPQAQKSDSSSEILGSVEPIVEPVSGDPARGLVRDAQARDGLGELWDRALAAGFRGYNNRRRTVSSATGKPSVGEPSVQSHTRHCTTLRRP